MTKFFESVLAPEITVHQKQDIESKCKEQVSTNYLGCSAYLVCERHA
ncbi:hypothetical protein ITG08_10425 [Vibrio cyclitrophicus]|nr:hypothetical protein [Vibrio cyclitrophicus]UPR24337.1 hypothetical protein ITG08_10425 [Vibrio cyclitrophicus]